MVSYPSLFHLQADSDLSIWDFQYTQKKNTDAQMLCINQTETAKHPSAPVYALCVDTVIRTIKMFQSLSLIITGISVFERMDYAGSGQEGLL